MLPGPTLHSIRKCNVEMWNVLLSVEVVECALEKLMYQMFFKGHCDLDFSFQWCIYSTGFVFDIGDLSSVGLKPFYGPHL